MGINFKKMFYMKKLFLTLACCLTACWCLANTGGDGEKFYKYSQEKKVEKVFDVLPNCELEMDGDYSDFTITTWDQPKIAFEVKVIVKSNKEKQMLEKFNAISVVFKQEGNKIETETVFDRHSSGRFDGSISIKYHVSVPADVRMDLETKYGNIVLDNANKDFKADVSYGSITANNLLADSEIDAKYSDINVTYAKNLELDMKYGNAKINKVEFIDADVEYSDFTSTEIVRGVFDNKYSDLRLDAINEIKTKNQYSDMKIANLTQKMDATLMHCDLTATVSAAKPNININGKYSDVKLTVSNKSTFKYDVRATYGDIICGDVMGSNAGKISEGRIAGKRGDGSAGSINAELQYGDIRIE